MNGENKAEIIMGQHLNEKSEKEESKITQHQVDLPKDYGIKL